MGGVTYNNSRGSLVSSWPSWSLQIQITTKYTYKSLTGCPIAPSCPFCPGSPGDPYICQTISNTVPKLIHHHVLVLQVVQVVLLGLVYLVDLELLAIPWIQGNLSAPEYLLVKQNTQFRDRPLLLCHQLVLSVQLRLLYPLVPEALPHLFVLWVLPLPIN